MNWDEETYKRIKECVSQSQKLGNLGMNIEEIAAQLHLSEEEILQVLTTRAYKGELIETDILISFMDKEGNECQENY